MLIQQVNLYQPVAQPDDGKLTPAQMAGLAAAFVSLLVFASLWLGLSGWSDARTLAGLEAELTQRQASVAALETELRATLDPRALEARLDALASELAAKQRVLEVLGGDSAANGDGFSEHLRGLSRQAVGGLWLRGFQIRSGGRVITLEGSALDAARIPEFLQRLGDEGSFAGKEFDQFVIERSESRPGALDFTLSNAPSGDIKRREGS